MSKFGQSVKIFEAGGKRFPLYTRLPVAFRGRDFNHDRQIYPHVVHQLQETGYMYSTEWVKAHKSQSPKFGKWFVLSQYYECPSVLTAENTLYRDFTDPNSSYFVEVFPYRIGQSSMCLLDRVLRHSKADDSTEVLCQMPKVAVIVSPTEHTPIHFSDAVHRMYEEFSAENADLLEFGEAAQRRMDTLLARDKQLLWDRLNAMLNERKDDVNYFERTYDLRVSDCDDNLHVNQATYVKMACDGIREFSAAYRSSDDGSVFLSHLFQQFKNEMNIGLFKRTCDSHCTVRLMAIPTEDFTGGGTLALPLSDSKTHYFGVIEQSNEICYQFVASLSH